MKAYLLAAGILTATTAVAQAETLTVYAPDYFTSEWGPGPTIEAAFEENCGCEMEFLPGDLLPRIMLEGKNTRADIVIGLNTDVTAKARKTGLFAPHGQDKGQLELPIAWEDDTFLPFDWAYVSFIYDTTKISTPPTSFEDLRTMPEDQKVVIQDPRSSISGLALVLWVKAVYGDQAEAFWADMAPRILTVTKGWSEAYGLFTDGEAPIVLSYNTSPAYHIAFEEDETKKAAIFEEGHYGFFELVAKTSTTDNPNADKFMEFVLSDAFQSAIPMTNFSYPSAQGPSEWPEVFANLPAPDKAIFLSEDQAEAVRAEAIEEWRRALSQ